MNTVQGVMARAKVVIKAAPTWLIAIAAALTAAAHELGALLPGQAEWWAWPIRIAGWLGAAAAIIRRVTPVPPEERGLLPVPTPPLGGGDQPAE